MHKEKKGKTKNISIKNIIKKAPTIFIASIIAFVASTIHNTGYSQQKIIKIDGSSTVYPLTEAVAEEFQKQFKDIKVTVGISGTGGGFKKFCRGETDISNASRPIVKKEMELCEQNKIEYLELPVAFDALAVVVNPKNNWADKMTVEELKKMWEPDAQGKIMRWSDIRKDWPKQPLKLFGAGPDSGTFDYFTEAIMGKSRASRGDYVASEDDNVTVQGVAADRYALGYFGVAYYFENKDKVKPVAIISPLDGKPYLPTEENVISGKYFPLSRPIFIYVNAESAKREEVRKFAEFYIKNAAKAAKEVGYIPLPKEGYDIGLKVITTMKKGTVFKGEFKPLPFSEVMKMIESEIK